MTTARDGYTRTALVVDDDAAIRHYVQTVLQQLDFETVGAANGAEALDVLRRLEGRVDLLVTDVHMQKMSGLELARAVHAEFAAVPLIVISGNCEAASFDWPIEFIRKPFLPGTLLESVGRVAPQGPSR